MIDDYIRHLKAMKERSWQAFRNSGYRDLEAYRDFMHCFETLQAQPWRRN